jgi:sec-independent protein translocase protein TatB
MREQVNESFGDDLPELRDLDLRKYHPKTFLRSQLLDDDAPTVHRGGATAGGTSSARAPVIRARDRGTPPPFDIDAT